MENNEIKKPTFDEIFIAVKNWYEEEGKKITKNKKNGSLD